MSDGKRFTRSEVSARNTKSDLLVIIENRVYDLTGFQEDHPGGHEVFLKVAGKDATEDFDDVGHSLDAKELMLKYRVGELVDEERVETKRGGWSEVRPVQPPPEPAAGGGLLASWKLPVALGVLATLLYGYLFG